MPLSVVPVAFSAFFARVIVAFADWLTYKAARLSLGVFFKVPWRTFVLGLPGEALGAS